MQPIPNGSWLYRLYMFQEGSTEMSALHGHNSRRPEGYLGFQGKRVEHGFESSQPTDGQAKGTGMS